MRILVPVDTEERSRWAVELALNVSQAVGGGDVLALGVLQAPAGALVDASGAVIDDGETDLSAYRKSQDELLGVLRGLQGEFGVEFHLETGGVTTAISRIARERAVELVVMGSQDVTGLKSLLSRSEAGEVALQASIPVLSLKCNREGLKARNVLVIGEFNQVGTRPLVPLKSLVARDAGSWHLLAVNAADEGACSERRQRMLDFAKLNDLPNPKLHFHREGDAELAVAQLLQEQEIDLMAIALRGGKLGRWWNGSLALALVNHFHKPIYTYPAES